MFQGVYVVWFLLPLVLTLLAGWALLKPVFKIRGREYAGDHSLQALFCWVAFGLAIALDQLFVVKLIELDQIETTDPMIVIHWVLFPAVLLGLAYLQKLVKSLSKQDPHKDINYGMARYKR